MIGCCLKARHSSRRRQTGAAILMAMLIVVLVATLASAMMWQQWRAVEVESAQRTRVQSAWILTGALDWARLILREDARQGGSDNLSEPWAVPLAPARLSTFLAAERGQALVTDDNDPSQDAFLAGSMQDLQSRLNVTNLVLSGKLHEPTLEKWSRLFTQLNLPLGELNVMAQGLLQATNRVTSLPSEAPVSLLPQRVADLAWLGVSDSTLQAISPFVTLLPARTPVNLNTASPEVLTAVLPGIDLAQARRLVQLRAVKPFDNLEDSRLKVSPDLRLDSVEHSISSQFFSVVGQLRLGQHTLQERSVLQRDGMVIKILSRSREVLTAADASLQ